MSPTLLSEDRILVFRHWPGRGLRNGQIVLGDLGKVLVAFQKNLPYSQPGSPIQKSYNHVTTPLSQDGISPLLRKPFLGAPSLNQKSSRIRQEKFVKRIVGLPGDTVTIHLSDINENLQIFLREAADDNGNIIWHIPHGYCFVRGDGPESEDSITWGPIPIKFLTGILLAKLPSIPSHQQI